MIRGRPVRFVALLLGGWTSLRVTLLVAGQTGAVVPAGPMLAAAPPPRAKPRPPERPVQTLVATAFAAPLLQTATPSPGAGRPGWSSATADLLLDGALAFVGTPRSGLALGGYAPGAGLVEAEQQLPAASGATDKRDRWSGTAWVLWRPQGPAPTSLAPRLGGSQAGARIDYALAPGTALYARLSGALDRPVSAELATGVALRPAAALPVRVGIERRQALSAGGRSDFAALVAGGIDSRPLAAGLRLDGYAQAGMVGTSAHDGFVDGRVGLERRVGPVDPASPGGRGMGIGASLWGGAQPGADRLDIGPRASVDIRVAGASLRVGAEWRQRVAGRASPASGFALVAGADF